jgi:L-iditol 2-dehydrogenase
MRSVILCEPGRLALEERPIPQPGPGEVVVRVRCATTCGTDLKAYLRGHPLIPMPGPFGHEYAGELAAIGSSANGFHEGDAVMGVHSAPCGECFWCQAGQENLCQDIMSTKVLGSFAEYLLLPAPIVARNLYHKPDGMDFRRASLLEPLACVANALDRLTNLAEKRVLIVGSGAVAILFNAALRYTGAAEVTIAGRSGERAESLRSQGLNARTVAEISELKDQATDGRGWDLVIEAAGNITAWQTALAAVRRGGTVLLFGGCPAGSLLELETSRLHYDDLTIISPFHFGTKAVRTAREWLQDPLFDPGPLMTGEARLEEASAVFNDLSQGRGIKVAFVP